MIHTAFVERMKRTLEVRRHSGDDEVEVWIQNKRIPKIEGSRMIYTSRPKKIKTKKGKKHLSAATSSKTAAATMPALAPLPIMHQMPSKTNTTMRQLVQPNKAMYYIRSTAPPNRRPLRDIVLPAKGKIVKVKPKSPDVCPLCFTVQNIYDLRKVELEKRQKLLAKQQSKKSSRSKKKNPVAGKVSEESCTYHSV